MAAVSGPVSAPLLDVEHDEAVADVSSIHGVAVVDEADVENPSTLGNLRCATAVTHRNLCTARRNVPQAVLNGTIVSFLIECQRVVFMFPVGVDEKRFQVTHTFSVFTGRTQALNVAKHDSPTQLQVK